MDYILHLWLKDVPEYTAGFCQLVLICSLASTTSNLLVQVARANGKIKTYQIVASAFIFLNFPLSYLVLKMGASPLSTTMINICVQMALLYVRFRFTHKLIQMSLRDYAKNVLMKIVIVTVTSMIIPLLLCLILENTFFNFIIVCIASVVSVGACTYYLGMDKKEQQYMRSTIFSYVRKFF